MDDFKKPFYSDLSLWVLLFSNSITIFYAMIQTWSLATILMVYLVQSCIIGVFNFAKIYTLKNFIIAKSTKLLGKPMTNTRKDVHKAAYAFAFAYGWFHFFYLIVLLMEGKGIGMQYVLF